MSRSATETATPSPARPTAPSSSFREVMEKVAAMLSEKWGIQVVMRGTEAYTDGRRIVIPVVPDDAHEDLRGAVHGVLDHEVGHVLFSEFFAIPDAHEKHLVNALEDAREEAKLVALWPGCARNLGACNEFFCRRLDEAGWPVSPFQKFCIALYFSERGLDDHWFPRKWIDTCEEIQPHLRIAREILADQPVHACAGTREVLALARKILAAIRALAEEAPPSEPPPAPAPAKSTTDSAPQPEVSEDAGDASDEDAAQDEVPDPAPAGASTDAGDDTEAAADSAHDEDHEDVTDDEPSAGAAESVIDGTEREDEADTSEPRAVAHAEPDADATGESACADITRVTIAELARDAGWTVQRFLIEEAREALEAADRTYLAFTTEHDVVESAPAGDKAAYQRLIRSVRGDVAVIKRTLARSLLASRKARWERGLCRGKVNPAALHKIPRALDRRVFRRREDAPALATRVSLLVDHSGSMISSRIQLAARATAVFAEVLAQLRVPFEVLGFTSGSHTEGQRRFHAAPPADRALFARWGALRTIVYKDFGEDFRRVSGRLDTMARFAQGEANYDGESLLLAARRLAAASRPGERRILLVLSDGLPAGTVTSHALWARQQEHLHTAIRQVRAAGIELFGIGIESDSVRHYYPGHVVVNAAADLPRETLRALDHLLRRG